MSKRDYVARFDSEDKANCLVWNPEPMDLIYMDNVFRVFRGPSGRLMKSRKKNGNWKPCYSWRQEDVEHMVTVLIGKQP